MKALSFRARRRNEAYKVVQVIGKQDFLVITPNVKKKITLCHLNYLFVPDLLLKGSGGREHKIVQPFSFLLACAVQKLHKGHIAYHAPVFLGHQTKQFPYWTSFPCGCIVGLFSAFILLFLWVLQA